MKNPFEHEGNWYKGNIHCHTTNSDGAFEPQELIDYYSSIGYSFTAITDHKMVTDTETLDHKGMVLIPGIELDGNYSDKDIGYHIVAIDVTKEIVNKFDMKKMTKNMHAQEVIDIAKSEGAFVEVAHPYWCGMSVIELLELERFDAMEVVNSVTCRVGKGISSVIWDGVLERGLQIPAVGVDDNHGKVQPFRGHTVVKADSLDKGSIMTALRSGAYYASTGPEIYDFKRTGNTFSLKCSPAVSIYFKTNRAFGNGFRADEGKLLTEAEFELKDFTNSTQNHKTLYVRAEVVGEGDTQIAWTNPIFLD